MPHLQEAFDICLLLLLLLLLPLFYRPHLTSGTTICNFCCKPGQLGSKSQITQHLIKPRIQEQPMLTRKSLAPLSLLCPILTLCSSLLLLLYSWFLFIAQICNSILALCIDDIMFLGLDSISPNKAYHLSQPLTSSDQNY